MCSQGIQLVTLYIQTCQASLSPSYRLYNIGHALTKKAKGVQDKLVFYSEVLSH